MNFTKPNSNYPLSTKGGEHIPHEVSLPVGVLALDFLADQVQAIGALGDNVAFLTAEATADCYISATNAALSAGINPNTVFIPRGVAVVFSIEAFNPLPSSYDALYCIGGANAGKLHIQTYSAWGALGEVTQGSII